MPTLRLMPAASGDENHGDEVLACAYAPDSRVVLSGGWDGCLRLWNSETAAALGKLEVGTKPVSACAVSCDGLQFLSGTLDGMLARWDATTRRQESMFLAHTRPISTIAFANDGRTLLTGSWDRSMILWGGARDSRTLTGHTDVVAGCCFTPNAQSIVSWSHDNTVRLWDLRSGRTEATIKDFSDRLLCGATSPDNRWAAFGGRDKTVKVVDLVAHKLVRSVKMTGEVRFCGFLLDGQSLVAADAAGNLALYSVPDLKAQGDLDTGLAIQCGAIAPSGGQLALGCNDGRVHLVAIDGFDAVPLIIQMTQDSRHTSTVMQRLFGKSSEVFVLVGSCPVCRATFEYPGTRVETLNCPGCRRALRVGSVLPKQQHV